MPARDAVPPLADWSPATAPLHLAELRDADTPFWGVDVGLLERLQAEGRLCDYLRHYAAYEERPEHSDPTAGTAELLHTAGLWFDDEPPRDEPATRPDPAKRREVDWTGVPLETRALAESGLICSRPVAVHSAGVEGREVFNIRTGEVAQDGGSRLFAMPCGNRRDHVCPHCSRRYRHDLFRVAMDTLGHNRAFSFVTLTGGSMAVDDSEPCPHYQANGKWKWKAPTPTHVGAPLDPEQFDYRRAASFNHASGALYSDWLRQLRRILYEREYKRQRRKGASVSRARRLARSTSTVRTLRVSEAQERGVIHHHLLILGMPSDDDLRLATDRAAAFADGYRHTYSPQKQGCHVTRVFPNDRRADSSDPGKKRSAYIGKYLCKSLTGEIAGVSGPRGDHYERIAAAVVQLEDERAEVEAIATADRFDDYELDALQWVAGHPECPDEPALGLLTPCCAIRDDETYCYATMLRCKCLGCSTWRRKRRALEYLGMRGHVYSPSHSWGMTLGELRAARRAYREALAAARRGDALRLVYGVDGWKVPGQGWKAVLAQEDGLAALQAHTSA